MFVMNANHCNSVNTGYEMWEMQITGYAFLWHQVRCMAAVLFMVGRKQETPDIVRTMLDITATPRKPQYAMASEEPLLLYESGFEDIDWQHDAGICHHMLWLVIEYVADQIQRLTDSYDQQLHHHLITAALLHSMRHYCDTLQIKQTSNVDEYIPYKELNMSSRKPKHIPLLQRKLESMCPVSNDIFRIDCYRYV